MASSMFSELAVHVGCTMGAALVGQPGASESSCSFAAQSHSGLTFRSSARRPAGKTVDSKDGIVRDLPSVVCGALPGYLTLARLPEMANCRYCRASVWLRACRLEASVTLAPWQAVALELARARIARPSPCLSKSLPTLLTRGQLKWTMDA
jgi:hypothetical protein